MSYFLKQSKLQNGIYLQIYEGRYDPKKKNAVNRCYKKLGYLENLKSEKIPDPIKYYRDYVEKLNKDQRKLEDEKKTQLIGESPVKNFGYFLIKTTWNTLNLDEYLTPYKYMSNFRHDLTKFLESLVYARIVKPCSKLKTYLEVVPKLYETFDFSRDQMYETLPFIGENYLKYIETLNYAIAQKFQRNTSNTYFDCTNYYFEIDYEKGDLQKGPCKENRPNPIIGQALLLDGDGVPMGMKMYPGNESEQPKIREVIKELKETHNIKGRTIQVADKGLNSGDNIYAALKESDGYIFSQSVIKLPEKEKNWVLSENDYREIKNNEGEVIYKIKSCIDDFPIRVTTNNKKVSIDVTQKRVVTLNIALREKKLIEINKLIEKAKSMCASQAKKSEYGESSKYVDFKDENGEKAVASINYSKIEEDRKFAGYNLIVTSEIKMSDEEIYKVYHNLWKIEDTFRVLKSELDSRPAFMQTTEGIHGHFLICYYAVTLLRLTEIKIFKGQYSTYELIDFIRNLELFKTKTQIANLTKASPIVTDISEKLKIGINHLYLNEKEVNRFFNVKFKI